MNKLIISGCTLVRTCFACPEQYDVFFQDFQIGYLLLRHGGFSADYLNPCGEQVYSAYPKGDGIFEAEERMFLLSGAVDSLIAYHNKTTLAKLGYED